MTNDSKYQAGKRAGLEAAAGICAKEADYVREMGEAFGIAVALTCADRIRAAIEQSQPQEVQPVAQATVHIVGARRSGKTTVSRMAKNELDLQAAGFASVKDLLAAWQGAQKDAALLHGALNFSNSCINDAFEGGDIDGYDIQERAASDGLLRDETITEQCGEHCLCADVTSFPTTCYRKTYLHLLAAAPEAKP